MRRLLFVLILWVGISQSALAERVSWDPTRTRAVIVGVLTWQDPSIGTFAKEERKDRELYDTLLKRGVPAENMTLLLDQQATRQAVLDALSQQLKASQKGETFVFYYAGHGVLRGRQVLFVPYDFGQEKFDYACALGVFDYIEDAGALLSRMSALTTHSFMASWPENGVRMALRRHRYTCQLFHYTAQDILAVHNHAGIPVGNVQRIRIGGGGATVARKS